MCLLVGLVRLWADVLRGAVLQDRYYPIQIAILIPGFA